MVEKELRAHPAHDTETDEHSLYDFKNSPSEEKILVEVSCAKCIGKEEYNNHICFSRMKLER